MRHLLKAFSFAFLITFSLTACTKDEDPTVDNSADGSVSGKVTDAAGNSLQGAEITVEHTVWFANYVIATSDANGNYTLVVPNDPAGSWTAKAQVEKDAYGQHYICDLEANDTAYFYAKDKTVRNFTWKLSGQKLNGGYYGAHLDVYQFGANVNMTDVVIRLTPIDPQLLDGSPASTIERNLEDVAGTFMIKDIPIGKYKAEAIYPGKTLLLENKNSEDDPGTEKEVVFGKNGTLAETEYNIEFWLSE